MKFSMIFLSSPAEKRQLNLILVKMKNGNLLSHIHATAVDKISHVKFLEIIIIFFLLGLRNQNGTGFISE